MRVLFLGGLGRSGTTLIERLLGEMPGVCPLGEVVHLWQRGVRGNERCGCGEPFHDCAFWRDVGKRAFGGWDALDVDRVLALKDAVDRTRHIAGLALPSLAAPVARSALFSWQVTDYADVYRRLYDAVREVTGAEIVVDSSKHASLAFCLRRCQELDLRVLHVVRDSRGVAHSWGKQVRRPEGAGEEYMARLSPLRAALHWNAQNGAFDVLGRLGVRQRVVRYEDVLASPVASLRSIADFAGLSAAGSDFGFVDSAWATLTAQHTASGNPMRFRTGRIELRTDEAWRVHMPAGARRQATALTWPLLVYYGYLHS